MLLNLYDVPTIKVPYKLSYHIIIFCLGNMGGPIYTLVKYRPTRVSPTCINCNGDISLHAWLGG